MNQAHIKAILEGVVPAVREYVDGALTKATAPLIAQIAELRAREPIKGDPGEPGRSVTLEDVQPLIVRSLSELPKPQDGKSVTVDDVRPVLQEMVAALPKPADGKSVEPAAVRLMVAEEVAKIPPASDGKSVTIEDVRPLIETAVAALPKPADGKSVDPGEVKLMVAEEVAKLPPPVDGKSVTLDDVRPVLQEMVAALPKPVDGKSVEPEAVRLLIAEEVAKIPPALDGKDGVGLAGAVIDREGELVVTLTDGAHRKLGAVVGKNGKRGEDGFGFEHLEEAVENGGRVLVRRFKRGDEVKEFRHVLATVIDRGVWKQGLYQWGDSVSHGGSTWTAQKDTETKPDTPDSDWRLSAKRGRDGKDFRPDVPRDAPPQVKFK